MRLCTLSLVLGLLLAASPAFAADCNLGKQAFLQGACPAPTVAAASPATGFSGGDLNAMTDARAAIDAFGYCRFASNKGDTSLYIPFGSEEEWRAYLTNHPTAITLTQCSRGGPMQIPPNFGKDGVTNQCVTLPPLQTAIIPYKPALPAASFTAPAITYACKAADGTAFDETAIATVESHDSGYGPSNDIGWAFTKIVYSYDGICGPAKGVETKVPPTTGLCSVGIPSPIIGTGPFQWICAGGNAGGKNITCSTAPTCDVRVVDEQDCRCENGKCYKPVYWQDTCGHSGLDKSKTCEDPSPKFKPLPAIDYDNDHLNR